MRKLAYSGKLLSEFLGFAKHRRIYWIVPLIGLMLLATLVIVASQTATPFLYTLF